MGFNIFWGDYLREIRKSHHLTQKELANILHVKRQTYSNFETGRCHPTPEVLAVLSNIYEVNMFNHVMECLPSIYLEEQHDFKYIMDSGGFKTAKSSGKRGYPTFRNHNYSEYNKNHTQ